MVAKTQGATRTRTKRNFAIASTVLLLALMVSTSLLQAYPVSVNGTTVAPASLPSWNPAVSCTATLTSIEGVIGNQANANGGATYAGGGFLPGIPNKRSTSPPCLVNGNATFVEIHSVILPSYTIEDCAQYPNGYFCSTTANVIDANCSSSNIYLCKIHVVIDQAWKSAGIAPQNPPSTTQLFDIQGFVYYNNGTIGAQWHSYSGWELHALTAWRLSSSAKPDFGLTNDPQPLTFTQGLSGTGTITVNSLDNFTGTVSLTATTDPTIANTTTVTLNPANVSIAAGGSTISTLTVQTSPSTPPGSYPVSVKGASGWVWHVLTVILVITPDFSISASPTSMSVALGSSGTVTITLQSLHNLNATVTLAGTVTSADTTASLSPNDPSVSFNPGSVTLTPNGRGASTLTVSASLLTLPGTYTVTVTANSGTTTHSTTVIVTVTLV